MKVDAENDVTVTSGATKPLFAAIAAVVRLAMKSSCSILLRQLRAAIELNGACRTCRARCAGFVSVDWQTRARCDHARPRMLIVNSPTIPRARFRRRRSRHAGRDHREPISSCYPMRSTSTSYSTARWIRECYACRIGGTQLRRQLVRQDYHCTGWKVGYCVAPRNLSAEFRKVHQYLTFCTFTPAQVALAEILEKMPEHYLQLRFLSGAA